jgi:hypothetical protein
MVCEPAVPLGTFGVDSEALGQNEWDKLGVVFETAGAQLEVVLCRIRVIVAPMKDADLDASVVHIE